jgi:hypothetical protein
MLTIQDVYAQRRHSKVPSTTPDKNMYPLFYQAQKISIVLNPGDILYIPFGWWHFVTSTSVDQNTKMNIAINNWTVNHKCDCELSFKPDSYRVRCQEFVYDRNKFNKILSTHTKLSAPFITHSNLHENYNLDYDTLEQKLPEKIPVFHSKTNFFTSMHLHYFHANDSYKDLFTFEEFYNMGTHGEYVYLGQYNLSDSSLNVTPLADGYNDSFLWINYGNVTSNLHYDTEDNLLLQIQGSKEITLFPPSERGFLYPYNPYPPKFMCYLVSKIKD